MSLWDVLQHMQITDAKHSAELANSRVDGLAAKKDSNKQELEGLKLACQAMWEVLSDRLGVTEDELRAKILEIDARDGVVDGKMGAEITGCPNCGRNVTTDKPNCVYCGHRVPSGSHVMK